MLSSEIDWCEVTEGKDMETEVCFEEGNRYEGAWMIDGVESEKRGEVDVSEKREEVSEV